MAGAKVIRQAQNDGVPLAADAGQDAERRGASRFTLLIRTAKLVLGDREFLCIIRDASPEGLKLRLYNALPDSEPLTLEMANGDRFAVRKVWERDEFGGFRFDEPVDLERLLDASRGPYPHRKLRLRRRIGGHLIWDGEVHAITVENISQQGAAIHCEAFLALDQLVRLECAHLRPVYAKIRWRRQPGYGLIFEETLALEDLAALPE